MSFFFYVWCIADMDNPETQVFFLGSGYIYFYPASSVSFLARVVALSIERLKNTICKLC